MPPKKSVSTSQQGKVTSKSKDGTKKTDPAKTKKVAQTTNEKGNGKKKVTRSSSRIKIDNAAGVTSPGGTTMIDFTVSLAEDHEKVEARRKQPIKKSLQTAIDGVSLDEGKKADAAPVASARHAKNRSGLSQECRQQKGAD